VILKALALEGRLLQVVDQLVTQWLQQHRVDQPIAVIGGEKKADY